MLSELMEPHGHCVTKFVKPGQTYYMMSDGCVIVQLVHIHVKDMMRHPHTQDSSKDSEELREGLRQSGYVEADPLFE